MKNCALAEGSRRLLSIRGSCKRSNSTLVIFHTAGRSPNPCGYKSSSREAFQQDDELAAHAATTNRIQWQWQTNSSLNSKITPRASNGSGSKGTGRGLDSTLVASGTGLMHEIKQAAGSPSALAALLHQQHCAKNASQLSAVQLSALGSGLAKALTANGPRERSHGSIGGDPAAEIQSP